MLQVDSFVSLLPELKNNILWHLTCKSLTLMSFTCKDINCFIRDNNLIEKRSIKGFPRLKECAVHDISNYLELNFDYISENFNLIKGDLIRTNINSFDNNDTYIFDGYKIISLDYDIYKCARLPIQFSVVTNNVPYKYWYNRVYCYNPDITNKIFADYNNIFYIDIIFIRKQCLDNIKCDGKSRFNKHAPLHTEEILYTEFNYNNITYFIVAYKPYSRIRPKDIITFTDYIKNNDGITLYTDGYFTQEMENTFYFNDMPV